MEKARKHQRDLYMCFIDYNKAFDCVDHERLWVILRDVGVPVHLIVLLRRLYCVHQPESDSQGGVWRDRQHRHWERCATGMHPLTTAIQYLRRKHNERGFGRMGEWNQRRREDGDEPEIRRRYNTARLDQGKLDRTCGKRFRVVTKFVFLGALITKVGLCEKEVRRQLATGKAAMGVLTSIWKDRGVTLETKVKLLKVLVFPIAIYGAENWTMRKHERRKIDAFELWYWRRVLRVSWMERKTNIWIIENIKPEWTLDSRVPNAALRYFGHVVRAGGGWKMT